MGDNVRLIYDLINYLNTKNKPGLLLCLDFEKAFDSLDWRFMFRALGAFGFGKHLCRWIYTFYRNIKSTVIVNGQTTQWFTVDTAWVPTGRPVITIVKLCYSESGRPRHIFSLLPSSRYSQMTNLPRETKGNNLGTGAIDVFIINR